MLRRVERKIITGIRQGQPEAFEAVIDENYKLVFGFLSYLCRDKGIAEDLTQDTFASAWANIDSYKRQASIKTWLHKIAYNKFLDSERKSKKHSDIENELVEKSPVRQTGSDPFIAIAEDEFTQIMFDTMKELKPDEYTVIVLHYIQDFSYKEMASVLKEPVGTIKWRTNQAIKKLREILTGRV